MHQLEAILKTPPLRVNRPPGNQSVVSKSFKNESSKSETSLLVLTTQFEAIVAKTVWYWINYRQIVPKYVALWFSTKLQIFYENGHFQSTRLKQPTCTHKIKPCSTVTTQINLKWITYLRKTFKIINLPKTIQEKLLVIFVQAKTYCYDLKKKKNNSSQFLELLDIHSKMEQKVQFPICSNVLQYSASRMEHVTMMNLY